MLTNRLTLSQVPSVSPLLIPFSLSSVISALRHFYTPPLSPLLCHIHTSPHLCPLFATFTFTHLPSPPLSLSSVICSSHHSHTLPLSPLPATLTLLRCLLASPHSHFSVISHLRHSHYPTLSPFFATITLLRCLLSSPHSHISVISSPRHPHTPPLSPLCHIHTPHLSPLFATFTPLRYLLSSPLSLSPVISSLHPRVRVRLLQLLNLFADLCYQMEDTARARMSRCSLSVERSTMKSLRR